MFAILRDANGRRHEVDFKDDPVFVDVSMSSATVQITMTAADPGDAAKGRFITAAGSPPPFTRRLGRLRASSPTQIGLCYVVATKALRSLAAARPCLRRQRTRAERPHRRSALDTCHISQRARADAGSQICVAAVPASMRPTPRQSPDFNDASICSSAIAGLDLESISIGDACLASMFRSARPFPSVSY